MRRKFALGLVLALGVIVAGLAGAITATPFNIIDFIGVGTAPSNPTAGKGRVYFSTADSQLHCLTSSGASCLSGGGGGGGSIGASGDLQFSNGAGAFQNAAGIFPATTAKLGVTGGFSFVGVPSIAFSASASNSTMSFGSGTGGTAINSTGTVSSEGAALTYIADTGDIAHTATLGNIGLTATAGNITETASAGIVARLGSSILDVVGDASAVTPGSVTQRVVTAGPDPIVSTDRGNRVAYNSASSVAVSIVAPTVAGFKGGYNTRLSNQNTGVVTITPTATTINGNATLVMQEGQFCFLTPSSTGTAWAADCGESQMTAGTGIVFTRAVHGLTVSGNLGTVTSVSFTGGLISVANPTTTPAFTVAGTSGGIPYFSGAATWASSAAGTVNTLMKWGGAGNPPIASSVTDNGTTVAATEPITTTGGLTCGTNGGSACVITMNGSTSGSETLTVSATGNQITANAAFSISQGLTAGGTVTGSKYLTGTNCSASGTAASPSVVTCSSASSGAFACATNASGATCQVNTTAASTNSNIEITQTASAGTRLSVTCNTTADTPTGPRIASIANGASFTINLGTVAVNPTCYFYTITN